LSEASKTLLTIPREKRLTSNDDVPLRLILVVDAEKRVHRTKAARASEAEKWRHLTVSTVSEDAEFIPELLNH
jgi:hypothetical protein